MVTLSTLHAFSLYKVEPLYTSMRMFEILKYLELSHWNLALVLWSLKL